MGFALQRSAGEGGGGDQGADARTRGVRGEAEERAREDRGGAGAAGGGAGGGEEEVGGGEGAHGGGDGQ
eukprot:2845592-Rhodomonas_salina.1